MTITLICKEIGARGSRTYTLHDLKVARQLMFREVKEMIQELDSDTSFYYERDIFKIDNQPFIWIEF